MTTADPIVVTAIEQAADFFANNPGGYVKCSMAHNASGTRVNPLSLEAVAFCAMGRVVRETAELRGEFAAGHPSPEAGLIGKLQPVYDTINAAGESVASLMLTNDQAGLEPMIDKLRTIAGKLRGMEA